MISEDFELKGLEPVVIRGLLATTPYFRIQGPRNGFKIRSILSIHEVSSLMPMVQSELFTVLFCSSSKLCMPLVGYICQLLYLLIMLFLLLLCTILIMRFIDIIKRFRIKNKCQQRLQIQSFVLILINQCSVSSSINFRPQFKFLNVITYFYEIANLYI